MAVEAWALAYALRRASPQLRTVAFVGDAGIPFVLRVLRGLPRPPGGGTAYVVALSPEGARAVRAPRGWTVRGVGQEAAAWLADRHAQRVDAVVARAMLAGAPAAARPALLDGAARRASCFVAWEPAGVGGITQLWPAWHSCALRERRWRLWGSVFEACAL